MTKSIDILSCLKYKETYRITINKIIMKEKWIGSSLTFVKMVHRIPKKQKVTWALLPIVGTAKYDLGVLLVGTDKVLNIRTGRFEQAERAKIASRRKEGDWYEYSAGETVCRLPKYYVSDAYYTRVYNTDMMNSYLF